MIYMSKASTNLHMFVVTTPLFSFTCLPKYTDKALKSSNIEKVLEVSKHFMIFLFDPSVYNYIFFSGPEMKKITPIL